MKIIDEVTVSGKMSTLHYEENPPFAIIFSLIMEAEKLFRYPQWKLLWVTKSLKTLKVFCLECFAVYGILNLQVRKSTGFEHLLTNLDIHQIS